MIRTVATAESEAHPHLHGLDTEHIHHCLERTIGNMWKDKDQLRRWKVLDHGAIHARVDEVWFYATSRPRNSPTTGRF